MSVFVGQGGAIPVFATLGIGKLRGDAYARLPTGPEFRHAFYVVTEFPEIGAGIEVGNVAFDEPGQVVCRNWDRDLAVGRLEKLREESLA